MPKRLPIRDIIHGLLTSLVIAVRFWLHYTLVAAAWLGVVPLTCYRIYKCLFAGSASAIFTLPLDLLSTDNLLSDGFYGCCVVCCSLCAFISLVWLREQILRGGPDWLNPNLPGAGNRNNNQQIAEGQQGQAPNRLLDDIDEDEDEGEDDQTDDEEGVPLNPPAAENVPAPVDGEANGGAVRPGGDPAIAAADDMGWNPGMEWDRAAEELTFERILGLDGSLVFFEHVVWVISLNTLFVLLLAFFPYHIGYFVLSKLDILSVVTITAQFEGLITTLAGYIVIGICLVILHSTTSLLKFKRTERFLGLCYIVIKVSLLSVFEVGVFPLVCGWWLDICSLPMLGAKLEDRHTSLKAAPGTCMFVHWLVGMVYVFYFASFILLLREVLRPGALWFLQNLNDPDFNPIHEMIHLPIIGHMRRFLASMVIFGSTVLLMIWFPVMIVKHLMPDLLPYNVSLSTSSSDSPVSELSLEFLLLQLVLPALLDHGHLRQWLKVLIRTWCVVVAYFLDLRSYLLGDVPLPERIVDETRNRQEETNTDPPVNQEGNAGENQENLPAPVVEGNNETPLDHDHDQDEELAMVGNRLVRIVRPPPGSEASIQAYIRPSLFGVRVTLLFCATSLSLLFGGLFMLTVPVITGRKLIAIWMGDVKVHELNTAACGLYVGLVTLRVFTLLCSWIPRGWGAIALKVKEGLLILTKTTFAGFLLLGVIPLLIGVLFDVVIIIPLRVPLNQTPIFYLWQDWAFGVLHTKVICGIAMMGEWRLKEVLEEIYHAGLINMNLKMIVTKLAAPVIIGLGLSLAAPYVSVLLVSSMFGMNFDTTTIILRRIYPSLLFASLVIFLIHWQISKFRRLYEHIKNDKYLVGRRLVNYDPKAKKPTPAASNIVTPNRNNEEVVLENQRLVHRNPQQPHQHQPQPQQHNHPQQPPLAEIIDR